MSEYQQQALDFLAKYNVKLQIVLSDTKTAPWDDNVEPRHHYVCTLSRAKKKVVFDFWGSINDYETAKHPTEYDVLAAISGDVSCQDTFKDFCADYCYDEDSIKALETFKRCRSFAKKLQAFFSKKEQQGLSEIN